MTTRSRLLSLISIRTVVTAVALAYGAGLVLHLAHSGQHERHEISPILHWFRDSSLSLPVALTAVVGGIVAARMVLRQAGHDRRVGAEDRTLAGGITILVTALVYALASAPGNIAHGWLFVGTPGEGQARGAASVLGHLLADGAVALGAATTVLLLASSLEAGWRLGVASARRPERMWPGARRWLAAGISGTLATVPLVVVDLAASPAAGVAGASLGCGPDTVARQYDVAAISVTIPYNRFGDVDPNGMVYVFERDRAAVENWHVPLATNPDSDPAGNRRLRPRPLVIRANQGECVEVTFTNRLAPRALDSGGVSEPRASMHVTAAATSARTSAGSHVGFNEDSTVGRGETITYYWRAPDEEGVHLFRDMATTAGGEADGGSGSHGLWGALAVEPAGSTWFDSHSGLPLYPVSGVAQMSGELYLDADIRLPSGKFFRESVQISQDEIPEIGFGFNYGADPQGSRDRTRCPDCVGEETSLSSWTYGEPAAVKLAGGLPGPAGWPVGPGTDPEDCQSDDGVGRPAMLMPAGVPGGCWTANVTHTYVGDPTKFRIAHAGVKETHVFHMHAHQWLAEPRDVGAAGANPTRPSDQARPESTTIDSQTYGPGEAFTADLLFGAGSKPGTVGDSIFHCHLYPHFAEGFWSLFRVHDVVEDGTLKTPDGVRTRLLTVLPDRALSGDVPGLYDAETNPGFPRFIPGQFGWRAPQAPGSISSPDGGAAPRLVAGQSLDTDLLNHVQDVAASFPLSDEVQRISNNATGGEFTVTFGASTTPPLPFDITATDLRSALGSLSTVGAANVSVSSSAPQEWRVAFTGSLGGQDVPALGVTDAFTRTVATTTETGTTTTTEPDPTASTTVTVAQEGGQVTGTFTLSYRGQQTTSLRADATPAAVEAALEALTNVADVTVAALGTTGSSWRVRFADPAINVRALVASDQAVAVTTVEGAWHRALAAEAEAQQRAFAGTGRQPKPGAPFTDPCPQGAREVTYNVSVLQRDIVYNDDGWHDAQGRMLVLDKDVPAIVAGSKKPEPLFFRVNAGDCVNFNLTNRLPNWYGDDAFQVLQQTNMFGTHIHLVKFDVLASDGSSNGWNYQQAAFSARQTQFSDAVLDGSRSCTADEATGACRLALPPAGEYDPSTMDLPLGQTIHERWYADYELRTVFTHDHHFPAVDQGRGLFGGLIVEPAGMDFRDSRTGEFHQPVNDPAHGPVCSSACQGDAGGTLFDVIGPGAKDDFREFGLAIQDFVPLIRAGGDPKNPADAFNPPDFPETFADDDPGVMGVNYRNEPFLIRNTVGGRPTDPAYVFSSRVHGDPATPLLEAYGGDPVRIRLVAGSQEEQHVFALHGMRWREEPDDPDSPLASSRPIGVSEAFNFEIPEMECVDNTDCAGDYLYSSSSTDAVYLGAWGLMRIYGKGKPSLLPLPDNQPQAANGNIVLNVTGEPPPKANKPGTPCPTDAPLRTLEVAATDARIDYNRNGDHDPYGLVYVAAEAGETLDDAVARAKGDPEPMALHVNEGDCVEVRLHNKIDPTGPFAAVHAPLGTADGDPALPLEPSTGTPAGLRVSLHPQLLRYDVRGSDGATVGFNRDQTVAPGESILYRWYADDVSPGELGTVNLTDYGDVRGHRHHGLFAGLTVHPRRSSHHDPFTGEEIVSGMSADIRVPGRDDYRSFTSFFQDGLNLRDATGAAIPDGGAAHEDLDSEDRGEKGFGYASSPYRLRLGLTPSDATDLAPLAGSDLASVLSSSRHGDPDTPIMRAYAGDPVRVGLLQGGDKPRQHTFALDGHSWRVQPHDPGSTLVGAQGGLSVDRATNIHLGSAGLGVGGDYLYADPLGFHHLSGGTWGIMRVYPRPTLTPLFEPDVLGSGTDATADNPYRASYSPLLPLELSRVRVTVYDDSDMNGQRGPEERRGPHQRVILRAVDGSGLTQSRPLDSRGTATFWVGRGAYDAEVTSPEDWRLTTPGTVRVDLTADGADERVLVGMVQLGDASVRLFNDQDGNRAMDGADGPLPGWTATLTRGTERLTSTTDAQGVASFTGLVPGTWQLSSPGQPGWHATRSLPAAVTIIENQTVSEQPDAQLGFTLPAGLSAHVFNDASDDGVQQQGESNKAGWRVTVQGGPEGHPVSLTATTDAQGVATFEDPDAAVDGLLPGPYRLTVATSGDWEAGRGHASTTTGTTTAPTPGFACEPTSCTTVLVERTTQVATLPVTNPYSWISVTPFNDVNNDGVKQDKESRLSGWQVLLDGPNGPSSVDTGNDGRATFYPLTPGEHVVTMISPEPSDSPDVPDWTSTNQSGCEAYGNQQRRCRVTVQVLAGETGPATFGFIQLGTVGVRVFHDYDADGLLHDTVEPNQPNRTVRLYDGIGKNLLQQKVTDAQGWVAFKVSAGTKYQVQTLLPNGWVQTTPLDHKGRPVTKVPVVGEVGSRSTELRVGQYNTVDSVPPPVPMSSVPAGWYDSPRTVALSSESGATIRYTLSGAMPTATHGLTYTGPFTISSSRLLRAIAIDAAGNASAELTQPAGDGTSSPGHHITVVIPGTTPVTATPQSWQVITGKAPALPSGHTVGSALASDDGIRMTLPSSYVQKTKQDVIDGFATVTLGTTQRDLAALSIEVDGRATLAGSTRALSLYDFAAGEWVAATGSESQETTDARTSVDVTGPLNRFVNATGQVRVRLTANRKGGAFDVRLDHLAVRVAHR